MSMKTNYNETSLLIDQTDDHSETKLLNWWIRLCTEVMISTVPIDTFFLIVVITSYLMPS